VARRTRFDLIHRTGLRATRLATFRRRHAVSPSKADASARGGDPRRMARTKKPRSGRPYGYGLPDRFEPSRVDGAELNRLAGPYPVGLVGFEIGSCISRISRISPIMVRMSRVRRHVALSPSSSGMGRVVEVRSRAPERVLGSADPWEPPERRHPWDSVRPRSRSLCGNRCRIRSHSARSPATDSGRIHSTGTRRKRRTKHTRSSVRPSHPYRRRRRARWGRIREVRIDNHTGSVGGNTPTTNPSKASIRTHRRQSFRSHNRHRALGPSALGSAPERRPVWPVPAPE